VALRNAGVFAGITDPDTALRLQTAIGTLDALTKPGPTGLDNAIAGVRNGLVETRKGASTLSGAGSELRDGSSEIREGIDELAQGVDSLDGGVSDLVEGVDELNDGMSEFAEGLETGAAEFEAQGISDPTEAMLSALSAPVLFDTQDDDNAPGLQATVAGILIPVGLWLVSLVYFVMTPPLTNRVWGSTAPTSRLVIQSLRPVVSVVVGQIVVVTALFHTLGAVAWSSLPLTTLAIALSTISFSAVHYALWMWKPPLLAPISISLAVMQVVTVGAVIPSEVLPDAYQALAGLTPIAWSTDALLVIIASAEPARLMANLGLLAVGAVVGVVVARLVAGKRRVVAIRAELGVGATSQH
jgi:putative membrane protein